jgi:serine/threonine protein kinase
MGLDLSAGAVIAGRYRLERPLGQGGMGFVWEATHAVTRRSVAVKVLRGPLGDRPEMRRRLVREARAASAVAHPNVVEVYDVFELDDATPVMVMALLRGETFSRRLERETRLSLGSAADILLPVVSAVGAAHALGIIHRDLKPENVFLASESGKTIVKVLDFGIAKFSLGNEPGDTAFTTTGTMLGTPCYMAPEQGFGEKDVDHRADIWAIGAMLYEALLGGRPVEGNNLGQVLKSFLTHGIAPLGELLPDLPRELTDLVSSMLAREKTERPGDLRQVHRILSRYASVTAPEFASAARPPNETSDGPSGSSLPPALGVAESRTTLESTAAEEAAVEIPSIDVAARNPKGIEPASVASTWSRRRMLLGALATTLAAGFGIWRFRGPAPGATLQPPHIDSQVAPGGHEPRPELPAESPAPVASTSAAARPASTRPTSLVERAAPPAGRSSPLRAAPSASIAPRAKAFGQPASSGTSPAPAPSATTEGLYEQPPF